jgi:hypothetical protein
MKPILLEVITKMITSFDLCIPCKVLLYNSGFKSHFHQKDYEQYPLDLKEEMARLTEWLCELNRLYKHRINIKLIDANSLLGIFKSLRFRIFSHPSFIIEKKETYSGWNKQRLEDIIDKYIKIKVKER